MPNTCDDCKHEDLDVTEKPCSRCRFNPAYRNMWEAKEYER